MDNNGRMQLYLLEQPFSAEVLKKYLAEGKEYRIFKNEQLFVKEEDFIYYIKQGRFRLCARQFTGDVVSYGYCYAGKAIQVNQFLMQVESWDPPFVVAVENAIVVSFSRDQYYKMIQEDQELFDEYVNMASSYSTMLKQHLLVTSLLNANQRLLLWLDKLCSFQTPDGNGVYHIPCRFTQKEIADYLFIHVTTCNKLLNILTKEHLIKREKNVIHIYDRKKLQNYLDISWQD